MTITARDHTLEEVLREYIHPKVDVFCCDAHAHGRKCVYFATREIEVISWLHDELYKATKSLEKIKTIMEVK